MNTQNDNKVQKERIRKEQEEIHQNNLNKLCGRCGHFGSEHEVYDTSRKQLELSGCYKKIKLKEATFECTCNHFIPKSK